LRARVVHIAAAAFVIASLGAWLATGREAFTRWPDARLEAADAPVSSAEQDLLDQIGIGSDPTTDAPRIESRFAFGLVPGGPDPRHLLSVATSTALAFACSAFVVLRARFSKGTTR